MCCLASRPCRRVLARGQCEATAAGREPQRLRPGAVFGAEEFLHGTPRAATVRAVAESTVLALDRGWYARAERRGGPGCGGRCGGNGPRFQWLP